MTSVYRFHIRQLRATVPSEPVPVPEIVDCIAGGRPVVAVWVNELGGVTFQVGSGAARRFVRCLRPPGRIWGTSRLRGLVAGAIGCAGRHGMFGCRACWARVRLRCTPRGCVAGRRSTRTGWPTRGPQRAMGRRVAAARPAAVDDCPFGPPPWVTDSLPIDRLVVCHGDACAPNTLIDDDGGPRKRVGPQLARVPQLRARRPRDPRRRRSVGRPGGGHAVAVVELPRLVGRRAA